MTSNYDKVFPAGAGMNRGRVMGMGEAAGVPRRRGDEPADAADDLHGGGCSPQARG